MGFTDPVRQAARDTERTQAHFRWRLLRDFFDYGNSEEWRDAYRERFARPLAIQRTLPGLLDHVEDGRLQPGRFKPAWLDWSDAVEEVLGPQALVLVATHSETGVELSRSVVNRGDSLELRFDPNQPVTLRVELVSR